MTDEEVKNVYYGKEFDLTDCIKNEDYSLYDLFNRGIDLINQGLTEEHNSGNGSFIIITDNQYIIGDTPIDGAGTHAAAYAAAMNLMYGTNSSSNLNRDTKSALSSLCTNSFITARIVCEPVMGDNGRPVLSAYINFYFPRNKTISENTYKMLEKFYNDFNDHIKNVIKKCGLKRFISINGEWIKGDDLTEVLDYFEKLVSSDTKPPKVEFEFSRKNLNGVINYDYNTMELFGERIIGVPLHEQKKY